MNHISFPMDADEGQHIFIDGQPLPGSTWLDWADILSSLERSGYWDILTCSCGDSRDCGGLLPVGVFCVDGVVAWRTYQPQPGSSFCFDEQQLKEAVLSALEDLEWRHFFNCDERDCFCPTAIDGCDIPSYSRRAKELLGGGKSEKSPLRPFDPTTKLLGAICRGDLEAVAYWAGAGADVNHVSVLHRTRHSVLQTALTFAPKAERLPIIKSLVKHGADVDRAMAACPEMVFDMLVSGDIKIGLYLAGEMSYFSWEFGSLLSERMG